MHRTKYITFARGSLEDIIVFSPFMQHKDVAKTVLAGAEILGAGFIDFSATVGGEVSCECYGDSISLKIKSREEDNTIANDRLLGI